jgi:hypothetical protein
MVYFEVWSSMKSVCVCVCVCLGRVLSEPSSCPHFLGQRKLSPTLHSITCLSPTHSSIGTQDKATQMHSNSYGSPPMVQKQPAETGACHPNSTVSPRGPSQTHRHRGTFKDTRPSSHICTPMMLSHRHTLSNRQLGPLTIVHSFILHSFIQSIIFVRQGCPVERQKK